MASPVVLLVGTDRLAAAIRGELKYRNIDVRDLASPDRGELAATAHELQTAQALLLVNDDDPANVDIALSVRRLAPALPIVVRLFDPALAAYLQGTTAAITILSVSMVTAPSFVDATERALTAEASPRADCADVPAVVSARPRRRYSAR